MLTVAVTGPTGEIGQNLLPALEQCDQVGRIQAMGRRRFEPAEMGWTKVHYGRGDILEKDAVAELVHGADVVVHLAFIIVAGKGTRETNLVGSRNVLRAAAAAGAARVIYTSSVAAYGFAANLPALITEDVETAGASRHPYSAQKAEVESELAPALAGSATQAYVFRPCVVAGPRAPLLVDSVPLIGLRRHLPGLLRTAIDGLPILRPILPDPGVPFQLVHHDDLTAALTSAVLGEGPPNTYNLAGDGAVTITDLAHELGWHALPVPRLGVDTTAELIAALPLTPDRLTWIEALRRPVLMDSGRARKELGWRPKHDARQTLSETVAAYRGRSPS